MEQEALCQVQVVVFCPWQPTLNDNTPDLHHCTPLKETKLYDFEELQWHFCIKGLIKTPESINDLSGSHLAFDKRRISSAATIGLQACVVLVFPLVADLRDKKEVNCTKKRMNFPLSNI